MYVYIVIDNIERETSTVLSIPTDLRSRKTVDNVSPVEGIKTSWFEGSQTSLY